MEQHQQPYGTTSRAYHSKHDEDDDCGAQAVYRSEPLTPSHFHRFSSKETHDGKDSDGPYNGPCEESVRCECRRKHLQVDVHWDNVVVYRTMEL